jgi:hypothetical protein
MKITDEGDSQLPDSRRFPGDFDRILSNLRMIIPYRTDQDDR